MGSKAVLEPEARAQLARVWSAVEALGLGLKHGPPGTFKLGRRVALSFSSQDGCTVAEIRVEAGSMGWAFPPIVSADDVAAFCDQVRLVFAPETPAALDPERLWADYRGPVLEEPLTHDGHMARAALSDMGPAAAPILLRLWTDRHSMRGEKLGLLIGLMAQAGLPASHLAELLDHADPFMVAEAVIALGRLGASEHTARIAALGAHAVRDLRAAVAQALGDLNAREHVDTLTALLAEPDHERGWEIREQAARSLAKLGGAEARRALSGRLELEKRKSLVRVLEKLLAGLRAN